MGSNANRQGDYHSTKEWGRKARKEYDREHRSTNRHLAIEDELHPKPNTGGKRRKKDTRRWCRGKVGREHDVQTIRPEVEATGPLARWFNRSRTECVNCGMKAWSIKR